jgi:hypothetical protein
VPKAISAIPAHLLPYFTLSFCAYQFFIFKFQIDIKTIPFNPEFAEMSTPGLQILTGEYRANQ